MVGRSLQCDVCVIGCGPAGITLSRELVESGLQVVMVESGRLEADPFAHALLGGRAVGPVIKNYPKYLATSRYAGVLGSASRWGGYCTQLTPLDFQRREWVHESGWPLKASDLAPFTDRAAEVLGISPFAISQAAPLDSLDYEDGHLAAHTYHYPSNFLVLRDHFLSLLEYPNFEAELGKTVLDIIANNGQVQCVRAVGADGSEIQVEPNITVLAAGGIENARILLLNAESGQVNIPANRDVLGRYFQEHFHVLAGKIRIPHARAWREYLRAFYSPAVEHGMSRTIILSEDIQRQEHLLNTSIEINAKDLEILDIENAIRLDDEVECDIFVRSEQTPNPQSMVVLSDDKDALGRRRAELHWNTVIRDWESIVESVSIAVSEIERKWGAESKILIDRRWPWPWTPIPPGFRTWSTWGNHHIGTTRMADDELSGIVDGNCRVHGMTNLFVVGSSVFPTGGFANPTFTIVTLSIRLARHLITIGGYDHDRR
jgi:choline dehydrogenase-like flavoprotein